MARAKIGYDVWGWGLEPRAWRAREREPITGVPSGGPGGRAPGGESGGRSPPEADGFLRLDVLRSPVIVRFICARCEA